MWNRLTGVRGLDGLRRALLAAALLSVVAMATAAVSGPEHDARARAWAGVALIALTARWAWLYARRRPSVPLDAIEVGSIGLLSVQLGADNVMPVLLAGLCFRSMYGTRRQILVVAFGLAAVHVAAAALVAERFPDYTPIAALAFTPLLLMVPGAAAELARGLRSIEESSRRERELATAAAGFLQGRSLEDLSATALAAISQLLPTKLAAAEIVLDPARLPETRGRFGDAFEAPIAAHGAAFVLTWEPLRASETRWLATLADQLALAASAHQARVQAAENHVRELVERTGGVALVVDDDLVVKTATPGTVELFGEAAEALVGRGVGELLHTVDRERGRDALLGAAAGDPDAPARVTVRVGGDDAERWVDLSLTDLRDDDAIGSLIVQVRDVTARVVLENDVRRRDDHDPLTGLPNRASLERTLGAELRAGNSRLALAVIDLDDFRVVNDTHGHAVGDEVLAEIGRRLALAAAPIGTTARLAADSFAVVLPDIGVGQAACEATERMLAALSGPLRAGPGTLRVGASAGVARAIGGIRTTQALLAAANVALESAQHEAKGSCRLFTPMLHAERLEESVLEAELAVAIGAGQLELDYQPVVDAQTGAWRGAEALVRWQHPELGRLGPARFVDLAERSELIVALGDWVLREACRQLAAWRADGVVDPEFTVGVNVSAIQLSGTELLDHVRDALEAAGLEPGSLVLEVTETAVLDIGAVLPRLKALRDLGVSIAIDDFGTGHSSLAYLKDLPADYVKIPRPFVRDAGDSPRAAAIIEGLVGLARPLELTVLAEGVETRAQRDVVVDAGCRLIQGFLYAAPMRPREFGALACSEAQAQLKRPVDGGLDPVVRSGDR